MTNVATEPVRTKNPTAGDRPLRVLFVKDAFAWPRASGHDIHTYYLMRALADAGHATAFALFTRPDPRAVEGVADEDVFVYGEAAVPVPPANQFPLKLTKLQEKFRGYWGTDADRVRWVAAVAERFEADAVVVVGLGVLPYLGACPERVCVWYAADEWAWHHLSLVSAFKPSSWSELKPALVKCVYERAYRKLLDRTWVVSPADLKAFRWFAGYTKTDLIHNGADTDHYTPGDEPQVSNSCTFWGRLDFEPNIQAIQFFCGTVWPVIRNRVPDATFAIYGFQPVPAVMAYYGKDGVTVTPNVPDIRPAIRKHPVVVLPFVSGGGVKNKLLEAAAMAKAVVGTDRVRNGLKGDVPFRDVKTPNQWADTLTDLWRDDAKRESLGLAARAWVCEHHAWSASAETAVAGIRAALAKQSNR